MSSTNTSTTTSFVRSPLEQLATGFAFTEGPVWDDASSSLYFTDIPNSRIHRWDGEGVTIHRSDTNKANGMAIDAAGRLLVCEHATSRLTVLDAHGASAIVASTYRGRALNSPNDVVQRSDGAIYFTDPLYGRDNSFVGVVRSAELDIRGVYLVRPGEEEPVLVADDFVAPNGLCFSLDESVLYVNDSERRHIRRFLVAADGTLSGGEVFYTQSGDPDRGVPDGMKVDSEGCVLVTGPGGIQRIDAGGELLGDIEVPEVVANFCFGESARDWIYITASTSLYRVRAAVPGAVLAQKPQATRSTEEKE
ncbi:SMP-30/gluconolactonase/LRE family protein [Leifsonia shinshuensis]